MTSAGQPRHRGTRRHRSRPRGIPPRRSAHPRAAADATWRVALPLVVLAVLAYLPYVSAELPGLLPGASTARARCSCSRPASSSPASP